MRPLAISSIFSQIFSDNFLISRLSFPAAMTQLVEEGLHSGPALLQYFPGREGEAVPQPAHHLQPPHQAEAGGEELQQVVVQQQHLQYSHVTPSR